MLINNQITHLMLIEREIISCTLRLFRILKCSLPNPNHRITPNTSIKHPIPAVSHVTHPLFNKHAIMSSSIVNKSPHSFTNNPRMKRLSVVHIQVTNRKSNLLISSTTTMRWRFDFWRFPLRTYVKKKLQIMHKRASQKGSLSEPHIFRIGIIDA